MPYRYLPELAATFAGTPSGATVGGWTLLSSQIGGDSEAVIRLLRQAVFGLMDPTSLEEIAIRRMVDAGIPVASILGAGGAHDGDCAQICRGDSAEYLGAAFLHGEDGVPIEGIWGKNFAKLRCTYSVPGIDVLGLAIMDPRSPEVVTGEMLLLLSAKHSLAKSFRDACDDVVREFQALTVEQLSQELLALRDLLRARNSELASKVIQFLVPIYRDGLNSDHIGLRVTALVDIARTPEILRTMAVLDGVPSTTDRVGWVAGLVRSLGELSDRVGP